jgi:hypothetical protein
MARPCENATMGNVNKADTRLTQMGREIIKLFVRKGKPNL